MSSERRPYPTQPLRTASTWRAVALRDEDEQLRWLAALSLQGIGGRTVVATLKVFIDQAPSAVAREDAEKVLGKLEATDESG